MSLDLETASTIVHNFGAAIAAVVTPLITIYGARQARNISKAVEQRNLRSRPKPTTVGEWNAWARGQIKASRP